MLHDAIRQVKGFGSSSRALLLSIVCEISIWYFLSVTVANFLLDSGCRQVKRCSRGLSSFGLTLFKLIFCHVNDGFLIHSSAEKPAPSVVQFEGRSEQVVTLLLDYNGTRIGICATYSPTEASQSDSNKEAFYKKLTDAYSSLKRECKAALVPGGL